MPRFPDRTVYAPEKKDRKRSRATATCSAGEQNVNSTRVDEKTKRRGGCSAER